MNAQLTEALATQRSDELTAEAVRHRAAAAIPAPRRHVPRWRVNWSRTSLAPAGAGAGARPERSWVIIISATTRGA
jgi:hypothetical protein